MTALSRCRARRNCSHIPHGRYNGLWTQETFLCLFAVVAFSDLGLRDVEWLTNLLVLANVPVAMYAVVQFLGWDPIAWPRGRSSSTIKLGSSGVFWALLGLAAALVILISGAVALLFETAA